MQDFLNAIGAEPIKVSDSPEVYSVKIKNLSQTVEIIKKFIKDYTKDVKLRYLVALLLKDCPSKAYECYLKTIVNFVKHNIKYVNDPPKLETIQSPIRTLELGMGDCDDHTILSGTLLRIAGFPVRLVLGDINHDGKFEHIFLQALIPRIGWVNVDTTSKRPFAKKPYPVKVVPLFDEPSTLERLSEELGTEELSGILDWIKTILERVKGKRQKQKTQEFKEKSGSNIAVPLLLTGLIFWLFWRK